MNEGDLRPATLITLPEDDCSGGPSHDVYAEETATVTGRRNNTHILGQLDSAMLDLLTALVTALNDPAEIPALEWFPAWRRGRAAPIGLTHSVGDKSAGLGRPALPSSVEFRLSCRSSSFSSECSGDHILA